MSSFDKFRRRNNKDASCNFLTKGMNSTRLFVNGRYIIGAVVYKNKYNGSPDEVYVYTEYDEQLSIGSVIVVDSKHILIIREDYFVYGVQFRRYYGLTCTYNICNLWGYLKGPLASYINLGGDNETLALSQAKPVFITSSGVLEVGSTIILNDRPWKITECDDFTCKGISIYSLEATVMPAPKIEVNPVIPVTDCAAVKGGEQLIFNTEDNYFVCSIRVNRIIKDNQVKLSVPYDAKKFTVSTKNNGQIETLEFEVK